MTRENKIVYLCSAVYFCSNITKVNYAAAMIEIIQDTGFSKTAVSMALTGLAISYALFQLVSGYLGDKFYPPRLILLGLLISGTMNLLLPVLSSQSAYFTVLWTINGIAQALMWPPMVKILTFILTDEQYKQACVDINAGSAIGGVFVYLMAPFFIAVLNWHFVFYFAGFLAIAMGVIWLVSYRKLLKDISDYTAVGILEDDASCDAHNFDKFTSHLYVLLISIMFVVAVQGFLRDGINNWTPTYVTEVFHAKTTVSIMTSVMLPLFSVGAFWLAAFVNKRFIKNELACSAFFFSMSFLLLLLLFFFGSVSFVISALLMALATGCMYCVNFVLVSLLPAYFKRFGCASLVSGALNGCTYVGSTISTYGIAAILDGFGSGQGWFITLLVFPGAAFIGILFSAILTPPWKKFALKDDKI